MPGTNDHLVTDENDDDSPYLPLIKNRLNNPKTVFSGGSTEFDTKVSVFTKRPGVSSYSEELARNSLIEVGQDLQFRAAVRSGDGEFDTHMLHLLKYSHCQHWTGWRYAKLKDLTIQKISKSNLKDDDQLNSFNSRKRNNHKTSSPSSSSSSSSSNPKTPIPDSAYLVLEDGCRNPIYAAIAPKHPSVDPSNPLIVTFSFKAFMFQDMMDGDTLRITAKIMACQEQVDCQPVSLIIKLSIVLLDVNPITPFLLSGFMFRWWDGRIWQETETKKLLTQKWGWDTCL